MFDLAGRVAVVTGAGSGIGRAAAVSLARSGCALGLLGLGAEGLAQTAEMVRICGADATTAECDMSDEACVREAAELVRRELGAADILVNNAAIYPAGPWDQISVEEWDRVFAVNVRGYFVCAREFGQDMKSRGYGKIVNISSLAFFIGAENILHYSTSKAAAVGFTRSLAREIGPLGITVNAVAPGAIPTEAEASTHPNLEQFNRQVLSAQSLKRRGTTEDVAAAVVFLASPGSDFITGQTLLVDGGWGMH